MFRANPLPSGPGSITLGLGAPNFQRIAHRFSSLFLMTRVKRGYVARKRRNKILRLTRSFRGTHSSLFRTANQQAMKALRYSYRDRAQRKREFRRLWITRINAVVRGYGLNYSRFMHQVRLGKMVVNRKVLSQLANFDPSTFAALVRTTSLNLA